MMVKTRIFDLYDGRYGNLAELAQAMGISVSQLYRVREGKRRINEKFIIGAVKAFPEFRFSDLFYIAPDCSGSVTEVTITYRRNSSAVASG